MLGHATIGGESSFHPTRPPPKRSVNLTPTLDSYTSDTSFNYIQVSRKRTGELLDSTQAKIPRKSTNKNIHICTANHSISGVEPKPNCLHFQSPINTLPVIFSQIKSKMCPIGKRRLIIFICDFALDFSIPIELFLSLHQEILQYVESRGHIITFSFLPYVPANSRDPRTKPSISPQQDQIKYLITINDKIKAFALLNPLKICFNHKKVGYNSKKDAHLRFQLCFNYTPSFIRQISFDIYIYVNNFVNSIP